MTYVWLDIHSKTVNSGTVYLGNWRWTTYQLGSLCDWTRQANDNTVKQVELQGIKHKVVGNN